jgi:methionyl-tRNA formyltransferase
MNIAFLLDKENNWIEPYVLSYVQNKNNIRLEYDHNKVLNNDIVFILGYTKILSKDFLNNNKLNLVIHESDLPKGKGFSPVQWQILEGKKKIIFTLFEANKNIDAGDIYLKKEIQFTGYELFNEIRQIQGDGTLELIDDFLKKYPTITKTKQTGKETVYLRRKDVNDKLNIDKSIKEQFNHFRIANNDEYPLWFEMDGHKYKIKIYRG